MLLRPLLKQNQPAHKNRLLKCFTVFLITVPFRTYCQEVDVTTGIDITGYVYETEIGDAEVIQNETIVIKPSIIGNYLSRLLSASLNAEHSLLKTYSDGDIGTDSDSQTYTDLKYAGTLTLIENALSFTLSGAQDYRNINQQEEYFGDRIIASERLTKISSNNAQLSFSNPNPIYLGLALQSSYAKTKADQSLESTMGIDSDTVSLVANLYQGKKVKYFNFGVSAQYNDTSRTNFQDFTSTLVQGNVGFPIAKKIDFIVTGSSEEYDTGQAELINRSDLDTSSYGAGFKWKASNERNISLTYNQLEENDNRTEFLGLDIDWAFSSRTSLNFNYGKRFFGDAYSFDFNHSLKSLRTSVTYSEDVTTFSRLAASTTNTAGIFVCDFGSTDLTDCFQPDSIDYQLQIGEEFRASAEINTDVSEEVLFRKSGTATIGYDKRKIKMSIDAIYQQTEYLESDRLSTNRSLRFNFNYSLGRKTNVGITSSIAKDQTNELVSVDTITTTNLSFQRDLGRNLKMNMTARLLDRESEDIERNGNDKRLTVGFNYTF